MVTLEYFNSVDLNGRAILTWEHGESIVYREYYNRKFSLYALPGFYVEVVYNPALNVIERVEALTEPAKLDKYLPFLEIKLPI